MPGAASLPRGAGVIQDQEDTGDVASSRATRERLLLLNDATVRLISVLMSETRTKERLRGVYMSLETLVRLTVNLNTICPPWWTDEAQTSSKVTLLYQAEGHYPVTIAAGALIGPAQVVARVLEFGLLRRFHPLASVRLAAFSHPVAAICLTAFGGPAAYAFAILHGAGNGILTIAKGTLPLALFRAAGYGARLGWLNAPARVLQAAAPLLFGAALASWSASAIWLTAAIGLLATLALFLLRRN